MVKKIVLGKPVRFLCVSWDDGWDFDKPSVLLEPLLRMSESDRMDNVIEDADIDICEALEKGENPLETCWNSAELIKLRGYKVRTLRKRARDAINGLKLLKAQYSVLEEFVVFEKDEATGEVTSKVQSSVEYST